MLRLSYQQQLKQSIFNSNAIQLLQFKKTSHETVSVWKAAFCIMYDSKIIGFAETTCLQGAPRLQTPNLSQD